jgi:hypothetical protein
MIINDRGQPKSKITHHDETELLDRSTDTDGTAKPGQ